jgi:tetratricopeptide (TPR) repeat protein
MDDLEGVRKAIATNPKRCVFVSRSGEEKQRELAIWIASRLEAHGHIPILQDTHLKHADFMRAMDAASRARVLALMSREYLASRQCLKVATAALDDQGGRSRRLVPFSVDDCQPRGLLRYVDRVDVADLWRAGDATEMERVLFAALKAPANLDAKYLVPSAMDTSQVLHPKVLMHDEETFAGREEDLRQLRDLLWSGGTAAPTLAGTAGVGKTTLARAYAFLQRGEYCAVWWLRAESTETLIDDLVELGKRYISGLGRWSDREAAARKVLGLIAARETNLPWLLVYDNAPHPGIVRQWRPKRNAHVLVTSRYSEWDAAVPLDVFTPEAAVEFLCDRANRRQPQDCEAAAALAEQLGRLPLALAHAARKCRTSPHISFADYCRQLSELWAHKPDACVTHSKSLLSVHATFSIALDAIVAGGAEDDRPPCPEAETVIGVLAHLAPDQVPEPLLAPLYAGDGAAMSAAAFERALAELAAAGLVDWGEFEDGAPHVNVHRLVQEIVRARLTIKGRAEEVAALATRAVESTFDATASLDDQTDNQRWLPQAVEAMRRAPRDGPEAWHTLWTQLQIGDLYVMRGWSLDQALIAYLDGLALANDLARADPDNTGWQLDLSLSQEKIGNVLAEQGKLQAARNAYQASLTIRERLASVDSAGWQCGLSVPRVRGGDEMQAQGNASGTLEGCRAAHAIFKRLVKADPGNAQWQRGLSVSHRRIGDVMRTQGNLPGALESYRASHAIFKRLAMANPGNAQWQRGLSVSHIRIGDVMQAQGNLRGALETYRTSHAIFKRLARANPGNAQWQRGLSVSHIRIGDVMRAQGNLPAALETYRTSHAIFEHLTKTDPGNGQWQRDLALSHERVAGVLAIQGARSEAAHAFEKGRAIIIRLRQRSPDNATLPRDLARFEARLTALWK